MKDVRGNEIKAGHIVHIWWDSPDGPGGKADYLCTACRTRGRGIKFVTDDGYTLNTDDLLERGAQFAIQGGTAQEKDRQAESRTVGTEELEMIGKLRELGWYGTLLKKTMNHSTFRIEMPETTEK